MTDAAADWTPEQRAELAHIERALAYITSTVDSKMTGQAVENDETEKRILDLVERSLAVLKVPGELAPTVAAALSLVRFLAAAL